MASEIFKKIIKYWQEKLGLVVYEQGQVPASAKLPYATINLRIGASFSRVACQVFTWHEKRDNGERMRYGDRLLEAIPLGGERLPVERGVLLLDRGDLSLYGDEGAIANRYEYQLRMYR